MSGILSSCGPSVWVCTSRPPGVQLLRTCPPPWCVLPGSACTAQGARADTLQSITQRRKLRRGRGWGYPVHAASWMAVACLQGRARPTDRPTASAGKAPNQACPGQGEALPILPPSLPPASVQGGQVPGIPPSPANPLDLLPKVWALRVSILQTWGKRSASGRRRPLVVKAGGRCGYVVKPCLST